MDLHDSLVERQALLQSIFDPELLIKILPGDFYDPHYRDIHNVQLECLQLDGVVTLPSIHVRLLTKSWYESVGGSVYLTKTFSENGLYVPMPFILKALRGFHIRRVANKNSIPEVEAQLIVDQFAEKTRELQSLLPQDALDDETRFKNLLDREEQDIFSLSYPTLDDFVKPTRGDLLVIGARTGVGKSAFLLNIALGMANLGRKCVYLTQEMTFEELVARATQIFYKRPWKVIKAELKPENVRDVLANLTINDRIFSIADIERVALESEADVLFVDYIQLLSVAHQKSENRVQELEEITRRLKSCAQYSKKVIIAASQLSRELDTAGRRPVLKDLRGCGSIEQDANMVIFIHNPFSKLEEDSDSVPYVKKKVERLAKEFDGSLREDEREFLVAKNRSGKLGSFKLRWIPDQTRFEETFLASLPSSSSSLPF